MSTNKQLTRSQSEAIEHIRRYAISRKNVAQISIKDILDMSNISWSTLVEAFIKIQLHARVALHFHPDRPVKELQSVVVSMLEEGRYKSQFETHISNGSVSAYPGGARDLWEKRLFGDAYHIEGVIDKERPKYGALDLMLHPDGPSPRFGSCYFLLKPCVSTRCTYTYGGSQDNPEVRGTYDEFYDILAAILNDAFFRDFAIGEKDLTPGKLINHLICNLELPFMDPSKRISNRNLNHYIEVQIHGDIDLEEDVEILVADPSFRGTDVGCFLEQICDKYSIKLFWHMGFSMREEEVPSDFRGPAMPSLAKRIARNGIIDARAIGNAVVDLKRNPAFWSNRGTYDQVLQELKYMWHILVRVGKAFPS